MPRHSCGFYLADRDHDLRLIQDYLGHRDPKQRTARSQMPPTRASNLARLAVQPVLLKVSVRRRWRRAASVWK
jgi:integrase